MRHPRVRRAMLAVGLLCVVAGIALIIFPGFQLWQRGQADQNALNTWNSGGSDSLAGPAKSSSITGTCGSSSSTDFALLQFVDPSSDHYAGVAGDGNWTLLNQRSMVHYTGTPDPGQQGNVIIAFHREPDYEHIDQLDVGGTVKVQDKSCHTYTYKVTGRWNLLPKNVTQLEPTSGHDLTLITCDPWYVDSHRLVWRLSLVS